MASAQRTDFIPASPDAVFEAITKPESIIGWHPHFRAMRQLDAGPMALGTKLEVTSARMGIFVLEVLLYEPGRRFSSGADVRGIQMTHEYELTAASAGTQLTQTAKGTASGFSLFGLLLPLLVRKSVAANATGILRHLAAPRTVPT